jgi:hypothetical protein
LDLFYFKIILKYSLQYEKRFPPLQQAKRTKRNLLTRNEQGNGRNAQQDNTNGSGSRNAG